MKLIYHSDNENVERFHSTIQELSELKHEHILPILDYGKHDLWYYIVTPYIADVTLEQQLHKGPLSPEKAGDILEQLADSLQFAHSRGIIYCNVKSSNVLLKDGHYIYLTGDSLSQSMQDDQSLAETGSIVETAEYVTPKLIDGRATLADNTYSLGILLCQMLTGGRTPSQALSPVDMQSRQTVDSQLSLSEFDLSVPGAVEEVIQHALARDPQERFQTPLEFAQAYQNALAQFISSTSPSTVSNTAKEPKASLVQKLTQQKALLAQKLTQRYKDKRPLAAAMASAAIITLVSLFVVGVSFLGTHDQVAQQSQQASQVSRASGKINPSPTISPTAQNKLPKKHNSKRATTRNGQTYGNQPTVQPTAQPYPTVQPTAQPYPTVQPTAQSYPTVQPTAQSYPTVQPTAQPYPTVQPTVQSQSPTPTPTPSATKQPGNNDKGENTGSTQSELSYKNCNVLLFC
jgi:serine/threonine-protein kinase